MSRHTRRSRPEGVPESPGGASAGSHAHVSHSATLNSAESFRTASTNATNGTVRSGSSILRSLLPSMRNISMERNEDMGGDSLRPVDVVALQRQVTDQQSDLDLMRANRQQEQRVYKLELHKLECEKSALEKRIQVLLRDMDDKNAMGEYAMLIKKAAPNTVDSTYVLKLQSQLAKAMHQMGTIQNQLTLTQQACDGIVKELRDEMRKITERNSTTEIDYLNQIMKLQDDNLNMKRQLESVAAATDTEAITEEEEAEVVEEEGNTFGGAPPPVQGVVVKNSSKNKVVDGSGRRRTKEGNADGTSRSDRTSSRRGGEGTSGPHRKAPQSSRGTERRARYRNVSSDGESGASPRSTTHKKLAVSSSARAAKVEDRSRPSSGDDRAKASGSSRRSKSDSLGKTKLENMVQDMVRPTSFGSFGDNVVVSPSRSTTTETQGDTSGMPMVPDMSDKMEKRRSALSARQSSAGERPRRRPSQAEVDDKSSEWVNFGGKETGS
mmetsp:Transcript_16210/g.46579  ORF Transcript_16210/g.46579 Transcript_16210/m.46579 type:complete len:495 (+) Transcript_16210:272-1756(+)|eukprot:CAMPEP_0181041058 /NCGR_PEP_ID=MMETSP1070-20121207/11394_1 /TAXON_ID=265543 /ORGANISM="Minutocellus polymorphus, Strain NH13" /LENGTH=494 /DNA_ID=CAMNT_0023119139 /DNA_START=214 /DNA_END=1698 /DNA_ORIENTATION=+